MSVAMVRHDSGEELAAALLRVAWWMPAAVVKGWVSPGLGVADRAAFGVVVGH